MTSLLNKKFLPVRDNPLFFFMEVGVIASHTELVMDQILVSPTSTWNSPVVPTTRLVIVLQLTHHEHAS